MSGRRQGLSSVGGESVSSERVLGFLRSLTTYSRPFWVANLSELLERVAFYGMTPILVIYLTGSRGFENTSAIRLSGNFGLVVYGLAAMSGFLADLMGYRRAMMLAYGSLAGGYFLAGRTESYGGIVGSLILVAFGASLIKPSITGTVQKTCLDAQRSVGFSIYYTLVNVGGFLGPNLSGAVSRHLGVESVFGVSAGVVLLALVLVWALFREPPHDPDRERKSFAGFLRDARRVLAHRRLVLLFVFLTGFWSMFFQFYGPLPLYLTQDLGLSTTSVGLIISLDPFAIICFQVVVGYLIRKMVPFRAILLGVLVSSIGLALIGVYPSAVMAGIGVLVFSVGEMIYSAHFYHYMGNIAPPGQVGMYMGFAFLPIALGSFLSGQIGGPIAAYCRDVLHRPQAMWFAFAAVGLAAAAGLALLTFLSAEETPH